MTRGFHYRLARDAFMDDCRKMGLVQGPVSERLLIERFDDTIVARVAELQDEMHALLSGSTLAMVLHGLSARLEALMDRWA